MNFSKLLKLASDNPNDEKLLQALQKALNRRLCKHRHANLEDELTERVMSIYRDGLLDKNELLAVFQARRAPLTTDPGLVDISDSFQVAEVASRTYNSQSVLKNRYSRTFNFKDFEAAHKND